MAAFSRARSPLRYLTSRRKAVAAGVFGFAAAVFVLIFVGKNATGEFTILVGGLFSLCGILCYDIFGRRLWENTVSARVETLTRSSDRLTREVARNRIDIAALRDGLAETASAAARERSMGIASPERSRDAVQDRTIGTILEHLAVLRTSPARGLPDDPPPSSSPPPPAPPPAWSPVQAANEDRTRHPKDNPPEDGLSDTVVRELVRHTLREGAIDIFLQPVVGLPQRKPRFYEVFGRVRARSDLYLPASRYMDFVHAESAAPEIDTLVLSRVFELLREARPESADIPLIFNVSRATLRDKGFMGDLILFLRNYHVLARRMVFEMPLSDFLASDTVQDTVISGLGKLGCRFSADHVETFSLDPDRLRAAHVSFLKMDARMILREGARQGGIGRVVALRKALEDNDISLIAEKIETEHDLRELLDYAMALGQGHLFGKPALPGEQPRPVPQAEPGSALIRRPITHPVERTRIARKPAPPRGHIA
ncbi:MAG: EAL domain-containing protein [Rhodospirillales bacterium]|nr:EAL domain-containing protein [Rhodospirillales bacterium]